MGASSKAILAGLALFGLDWFGTEGDEVRGGRPAFALLALEKFSLLQVPDRTLYGSLAEFCPLDNLLDRGECHSLLEFGLTERA